MGFTLLLTPTVAFSEGNTGVMDNDFSVSEKEKLVLQLEAEKRDKVIMRWAKEQDEKYDLWLEKRDLTESEDVDILANPDGEHYSISVANYKQEKNYYCGPAAARQTLGFHKTKSGSATALPSQTTLASRIGTDKQGASSSYGIKDTLNFYQTSFGFKANPYGVADIENASNPTATFESRIKYVLSNRINAPIILMDTKYLPRYNGHSVRHYNTVSAYSFEYASGKKQVKTVDPHYSTTYYGAWWNPLGTTGSNGVVRAVYQADKGYSNPVMIY